MPGLFTARRALGLTQGEVGELIGKSQAHYGKIENGCVELSAKDALALCSYFGITIQELMKGMK
jgi:DNA-binding XRE family transcriptional regulator